jgi:hypothetical protein
MIKIKKTIKFRADVIVWQEQNDIKLKSYRPIIDAIELI